ncbi:MAG: hypothetical protein AAF610_14070 [Pseudomonadota bacterium]
MRAEGYIRGVARAALLLVLGLPAANADSELTLEGHIDHAVGIDGGDRLYTSLEVLSSYTRPMGERSRLKASARLRLGSTDRLEPGGTTDDAYAPLSRPWVIGSAGSAEIRDLFLEHQLASGRLRIGKQTINWGRLDGIKVLDVVNPQDYRTFILDDFEQSRTSLWSGYSDTTAGAWRREVAVVVDGTAHAIPDDDAWFGFRAPRFRFGSSTDQQAAFSETQRPGHGIGDAGFGVRLSRQTARGEFAVLAYRGLDPEPLGRFVSRAGEIGIQRFYEPRSTLGASFDAGLGGQVIRGEFALHPDRAFNTRNGSLLDTDRRSQIRAALGVDLSGPGGALVNLQFLYDRVEGERGLLVRPVRDRLLTLGVRKTLGFDRWIFQVRAYRSLDDDDQMLSLKVTRSLSETARLEIHVASFNGDRDGVFGQFEQKDMAGLRISQFF